MKTISPNGVTASHILRLLTGDVTGLRELEGRSAFDIARISEQIPVKARTLSAQAVRRVAQDLLNARIARMQARSWANFMATNDAIEYEQEHEVIITEALLYLEQKGDALYAPVDSSIFTNLLERLSK